MKQTKHLFALGLSCVLAFTMLVGCNSDSGNTTTTTAGGDSGAVAESKSGDDESGNETVSGGGSTAPAQLPRNETLYFNGLQWGAATNWNPISGHAATFMTDNASLSRVIVYETLFRFNLLDSKLYPLLATDYSWEGEKLTVTLNSDAKFNDGTPVTADDVVYSYELGDRYAVPYSADWAYIDSIVADDEQTVIITGKSDNFNSIALEDTLSRIYILPKHIWEEFEEEAGNDGAALMQLENSNPVSSGPYKVVSYDDTKNVLIRDDNYWGQAESMFGKLPAPKYLVHNIYKDNSAGDQAFKDNQVDVSQQFTPQIWTFWENGEPISTYLSDLPYYIPGVIPSIVFNTTKPGLDDPVVRKAIAMSIDYTLIGENAMSGYTAPIQPSLMLPTDTEQALIDTSALAPLQWTGKQYDEANALLDEAGWLPGSDGVREKDGVKLSFSLECPTGWADWQASLEVIAQGSKNIGMDLHTYFPEAPTRMNNMQTGNFDITMNSYSGAGMAATWVRARDTMSSEDTAEIGTPTFRNYGRYENARADEIIAAIPKADAAEAKELWTELNQIWLEDVPTVGLMYRPVTFHAVNETYWTGFPKEGDGSNIPPTIAIDGYGIEALYNIEPK